MLSSRLLKSLRNISVLKLVRALERDGFIQRRARGSVRLYRHPDGRRVVIHYHRGGDTLVRKTLQSVLRGTRWTEKDLENLDLF